MAVDKLVDSAQLDADLTSVADAIRTKGGTSALLSFPSDFISAINAISGGGVNTIDSDYLTVFFDIVTVGANNATNYDTALTYLTGLIDDLPPELTLYTRSTAFCSIVEKNGVFSANNTLICTDLSAGLASLKPNKFYRYRNGVVTSVSTASSYDATISEGDKYLIVVVYMKAIPS